MKQEKNVEQNKPLNSQRIGEISSMERWGVLC